MGRSSNQKLKILYVLDILKKFSDEEHPLNANDIVKYLEEMGINAERKSIYDDIASLEFYGCDIIKALEPKIGWFIGEREFEIPEIYLLSDAVRTADFISSKKSRELLSKLNGMLSIHKSQRRKDAVFVNTSTKTGNEEIYYSIDAVSRAIEEKKQIKIKYISRKLSSNRNIEAAVKEMVLNPYALCWQDDHYYLIGNYEKYDNLIHLRLDRIKRAEITDMPSRHFGEVSEYKEFFDTADYLNKIFGMHSGSVSEASFICKKEITEQVFDRFGENIFIKGETEESFRFSVKVAFSDALVTWIINYGNRLKVEKPEELKEMVKKRAKQVLENYI